MPNEFITNLSATLQREGYLTENKPILPGVQALLYARSPRYYPLGFAKVEDHFLFIDLENAAVGHPERLREIYQHFSAFVNKGFPLPHALRTQIPNLALVLVLQAGFSQETIRFACTTYFNPWYGGETGQLLLIDLGKKQVFSHLAFGNRQPGALPLTHAAERIRAICQFSITGPALSAP